MRWINTYELQMHEPVQSSQEWQTVQEQLREAIAAIVWPPESAKLTINPTLIYGLDKNRRLVFLKRNG